MSLMNAKPVVRQNQTGLSRGLHPSLTKKTSVIIHYRYLFEGAKKGVAARVSLDPNRPDPRWRGLAVLVSR